MNFLALLLFLIAALVMVKIHLTLASNNCDLEKNAAEKFATRAHKLIEQAVKIDLMPYSFEKHSKFSEWSDETHSYMDDFEAEIREAAKASPNVILEFKKVS